MKCKKDLLFLCQFFYPEYSSSATLPFDTAKHMTEKGFTVGAMCGNPKEYTRKAHIPKSEIKEGVEINRLKYIQLNRSGFLGRIINYFSFTLAALLHVGKLRKYKIVVVYSNPPILPIVAIIGKILFKTKIVFVSYDVYPEIAINTNTISAASPIVKVMSIINKYLYRNADKVVSLTDEMKDYLICNRVDIKELDKVVTISNWAHEEKTKNEKKKYGFEKTNEKEIVVSYFGNMGICQEMETIVDLVESLKLNKNIRFVLAAHGCKKKDIYQRLDNNKQVKLYDYLEGDAFEKVLKNTTFGIVSLEKGLKGLCAPSKYYSYLQSGIPVIAIVEKNSYLEKEILENDIGMSVNIGEWEKLKEFLLSMQNDIKSIEYMSENALSIYKTIYSKEIAMEKYADVFNNLCETSLR